MPTAMAMAAQVRECAVGWETEELAAVAGAGEAVLPVFLTRQRLMPPARLLQQPSYWARMGN